MRRALLALVALVALAGCLAESPGETVVLAGSPPAATLRLSDCHAQHLFFPAPADGFAGSIPPGFRLVTSDEAGATTMLGIFASRCTLDGEEAILAWVELPVEPPAELAGEDARHAVPIEAHASPDGLAAAVAAMGFGDVVEGADIRFAHTRTPSPSTEVEVAGASASSWRTTLSGSSGTFGAETVVRWAWDGVEVRGKLRAESSEGSNVGFGTVAFRSDGSGGAPPFFAGIAHEIEAADLALVREEVGP